MSGRCVCPVCAFTFGEREAYCEDWQVPARSFGCPHCKTFLRKLDSERLLWRPYLAAASGVLALMLAVLWAVPHFGVRPIHLGPTVSLDWVALACLIAGPVSSVVLARWLTDRTAARLAPYEDRDA